jgi:hypothetical protein
MSVQKKSLISQRSAVKSAILATPETSNSAPTVRAAARPAVTAKGSIAPRVASKLKISPKVGPRVLARKAPKVAGRVLTTVRSTFKD